MNLLQVKKCHKTAKRELRKTHFENRYRYLRVYSQHELRNATRRVVIKTQQARSVSKSCRGLTDSRACSFTRQKESRPLRKKGGERSGRPLSTCHAATQSDWGEKNEWKKKMKEKCISCVCVKCSLKYPDTHKRHGHVPWTKSPSNNIQRLQYTFVP